MTIHNDMFDKKKEEAEEDEEDDLYEEISDGLLDAIVELKQVGSLWRGKRCGRLYCCLGEARPSDYYSYAKHKQPATWKEDFPPDFLMVDLDDGGFLIKSLLELKKYFDPVT